MHVYVFGDVVQIMYMETREEKKAVMDEQTSIFNIPIGYVQRYKFYTEKKDNYFLELVTKDQRKFKFRFESPFPYQRANDALQRHVDISKIRDLFTFDYSKKIRENMQAFIASQPPNTPVQYETTNTK